MKQLSARDLMLIALIMAIVYYTGYSMGVASRYDHEMWLIQVVGEIDLDPDCSECNRRVDLINGFTNVQRREMTQRLEDYKREREEKDNE